MPCNGLSCFLRSVAAVTLWLVAGVVPLGLAADAPDGARLVASEEPGWPQWRGARRDGISTETGLLQAWPAAGPSELWRAGGLGRGYSSPIITGGTLYITGDVGEELRVFALDLAGKLKWQTTAGKAWRKSWPGSRASCVYAGGRLYLMDAFGRVACLDPTDGRELWAVDIATHFEGKLHVWGLAECLLVDGPRVIVTPVGSKALMAALDRETGDTVWTTAPIPDDKHAYASPILFERAGRRQIVSYSSGHQFGVDAETGQLLWKLPWGTGRAMIGPMPMLDGDAIITSASSIKGGITARIRLAAVAQDVTAERLWSAPVDDLHGTAVLLGGRIYSSGNRTHKGWACIDADTGNILYRSEGLARGCVIYADNRLYCLSQDGIMSLFEPGEDAFHSRGQFRLVPKPRKPDVWSHPVIWNGRLYLRYHDTLRCFDVRRGNKN